jgi:hypothetical protein
MRKIKKTCLVILFKMNRKKAQKNKKSPIWFNLAGFSGEN